MKYQMKVTGMHCQGCSNLIKMSLEDANIITVLIDVKTGTAQFESDQDKPHVEKILSDVFTDLGTYRFSNVEQLV
ncbi:hypothetical protein COX64_02670 [Candidatus Dojkabacteria bacterium CG_4_10_14_0_2_um_filter_Dojkabacteria_WS6_41_15]|uniref:HMA domain-containing protein n=1 Tax=Candidatus Dojkabacteria bacterium CG_4_10_14_0_2_um_filter_Dojkabacteria_WS6_41_15 TaxID=2014249 RepID=A0A2M7W1V9_9BACT|nr:MAG: hypothetical protein COX64_02670 [Candidatus Dojkabacteria bacterium CG_4_10_14_0_2_um_filter_Dojkabacteria_WS6_41_15]